MLCTLAAIPSILAVAQLGRIHPDEVYQVLEPAWYRAHGYGVMSWEWKEGIRNWAIPGLFSWLLRLCRVLGIEHPLGYRAVLELPQYALHLAALAAVERWSRRSLPVYGAWLATALVALYRPVLEYAGRTLSESFSAAFLVLAFERIASSEEGESPERRLRRGMVAGALLGLAVVSRYGSMVFVIASLGWLLAGRQWRVLGGWVMGGAGVALGLALLDWLTWGRPLHSLWAYTTFNVFSGQAAEKFGAEPPGYYVPIWLKVLPLWSWFGLWGVLRRHRSALPFLGSAALYLVAISATAHKEDRFLYPATVLWVVGTAPATVELFVSLRLIQVRAAAALGALVLSLATPLRLEPPRKKDHFQAIVRATRSPDTRGLLYINEVPNESVWGAGGYFYIGKDIPWLTADRPGDANFQAAMKDPTYNRVVTFRSLAVPELERHGFSVVERIGRATVLARGSGG
ncbi:glycosyltransferase family protein [Archangium lipolyticum]|uniref:mannosyltransferase n=1 Tax=Archangium lipolyticum TaxID=2970465 RepID=UPI00214A348E|nr:mannosyltransferase [Archangium lipolyticum]